MIMTILLFVAIACQLILFIAMSAGISERSDDGERMNGTGVALAVAIVLVPMAYLIASLFMGAID